MLKVNSTEAIQIRNVVLGNFNGQVIYLKDVATVKDSIKEMTMDEKINGRQGVRMMVMKQSGANTVKIASEVQQKAGEYEKEPYLPMYRSSRFSIPVIYIRFHKQPDRNSNVCIAICWPGGDLFPWTMEGTFIIIMTIPISLIVSFIFLNVTGSSINIISLSALSIAIGMVVDDAIVVLENITRHIDRGSSPREAAIYATNEVWLAVIVTTLTVVAVFFPMTMISGMTGILFRQLGWIVTITVVTSTLAAITLTPMLSSKMLRLRKKKRTGRFSHERHDIPMFDRLDNWYGRCSQWSLKHKTVIIIVTFVVFFASLFLAGQSGYGIHTSIR